MGKDTGKIDDAGKRICYKSLGPDFLTVMYDNATEDVVLLDYPKFNELDSRNQDHLREMEDYYYANMMAFRELIPRIPLPAIKNMKKMEHMIQTERNLQAMDS